MCIPRNINNPKEYNNKNNTYEQNNYKINDIDDIITMSSNLINSRPLLIHRLLIN